jgi:hypothetical protein
MVTEDERPATVVSLILAENVFLVGFLRLLNSPACLLVILLLHLPPGKARAAREYQDCQKGEGAISQTGRQ